MDIKELKSIIEALLFTWGDPLEIKDIASILELDKEELAKIIQEMIDEFDYNMRGLKNKSKWYLSVWNKTGKIFNG